MQTISIKQTLRPNKIGIIIPVDDEKALMQAIEINTLLWGGRFNPIIPFCPEGFEYSESNNLKKFPAEKIIEGYLNTFDPDFILPINIDEEFLKKIDIGYREIIGLNEGMYHLFLDKERGSYKFGTCFFEVLRFLYEKELKFIHRDGEIQFAVPDFSNNNPFIASIFGHLDETEAIKSYKLKTQEEKITSDNYLVKPPCFSPGLKREIND